MPTSSTLAAMQDPAAVSSQLTRILASPHFRNSKRSQALLRFVVEAAITGDQQSLKERCVGSAVFGREAAYDTAQDPIVRNAAIEVRKRLAQYYLESGHINELRIDLPSGSYMPVFVSEVPAAAVPAAEAPMQVQTLPAHNLRWVLAASAVILLALACVYLWTARRTAASELEALWAPLLRDRKTIQICIGQPTRLYRFTGPRTEDLNRMLGGHAQPDRDAANVSLSGGDLTWVAPEYLFLRDALSALNIASWLQSRGRAYDLRSIGDTSFSRLRREPLVVIGAFNNAWAMRVTGELRFVFEHKAINGVNYNIILDRRNPNAAEWKVAQPVVGAVTQDYAIVTRVSDPNTEKVVMSAAGIEAYGTLAASEFVTHPEYAGAALRAVPEDWRRRNVQFVLRTRIIDGTPGPPQVLATHFW